VGLPELASDARYDSVRKRNEHAGEIVPRIRAALATRTATEWEAIFGERVPCAAARSVEDMFDHPQVVAENMIDTYEHPLAGSFRGIREPILFGASPAGKVRAAPTFGQHSAEVLADAGYTHDEIAALKALGALGIVAETKANVDV
jgi:crotonobetainyl-CoA:carnitine CoA-transferase CaiB-like acyl-CoA transferase